jgi:chromate transport protein ChrA
MVVSDSRSELTIAINDAESVPSTTALSGHTDLESQEHNNTPQPHKEAPAAPHDPAGLEDNSRVPYFSLPALFWFFFYNFGLFAWGGPVVQIALIKDHLVIKEQWITLPRFQRVFAVYQMVPGPSASALCMFFGCLSRGRIGGIVAGIGFILPGFLLMLLASYLYSLAGSENKYFNASLRALQPIVSAMVREYHLWELFPVAWYIADVDLI